MKKSTLFFGIFLLPVALGLPSCSKVNTQSMKVIRDCTGTYLRADGQDFRVCNTSALGNFDDNEVIHVTVEKVEHCDPPAEAICLMAHEHRGLVKVREVH